MKSILLQEQFIKRKACLTATPSFLFLFKTGKSFEEKEREEIESVMLFKVYLAHVCECLEKSVP